MEVCPKCGDFVLELRDDTGWCFTCSPDKECVKCGKPFQRDQRRDKCPRCRHLEWLEKNADLLEIHLAEGVTLGEAIAIVRIETRPRCLSCGDRMRTGRGGHAYFCYKLECRTVYNRYERNRAKKTMSDQEALREALAA